MKSGGEKALQMRQKPTAKDMKPLFFLLYPGIISMQMK